MKNLTIVLLGVFLCLNTFIGCSTIDIPSTTNGGQVVEDSSSNNVPSSNSNVNLIRILLIFQHTLEMTM